MTEQPTALRLADLIDWPSVRHGHDAAAELRRLHEENKELKRWQQEALKFVEVSRSFARAAIAKAQGEQA